MSEKLDLGYGNPGFLQDLWQQHLFLDKLESKQYMPYMYGKRIFPELEEQIKKLHLHHNNAVINENTHIIITVGAVQALQAAMSAYKKQAGLKQLYIPKPYWIRFKDFAEHTGLNIVDEAPNAIKLITSPNNPDGKDQSAITADIRDACYNWPHYTDNVMKFDDKVAVYSLSKLSGHSSTRIGWAVVQDPELANFMKYYVNIITSGVSVEAQLIAYKIISSLNEDESFFQISKGILKTRYKLLKSIVEERNLPIKINSHQGMFWYINCDSSIIEKLNIECPGGCDFSDPVDGNYRLNLGADSKIFDAFVERLKKI